MKKPVDRMKKLLTMARRGTPNEAKTARAKLNNLLAEHGLTEDDLTAEEKKRYWFTFKNVQEREIIYAVCRNVMRISTISAWTRPDRNRAVGFDLTAAEYIRIKDHIEVYQKAFREEIKAYQERLIRAFIHKHKLYSNDDSDKDDEESKGTLSQEEIRKIIAMMDALDDIERPVEKIEA